MVGVSRAKIKKLGHQKSKNDRETKILLRRKLIFGTIKESKILKYCWKPGIRARYSHIYNIHDNI